jgi:hypothetical protein
MLWEMLKEGVRWNARGITGMGRQDWTCSQIKRIAEQVYGSVDILERLRYF